MPGEQGHAQCEWNHDEVKLVSRDGGGFSFTVPNIALSLAALSADRASVRVHFSHESLPPCHPHHDWPDYHAYFIVLDVSTTSLTAAAAQWNRYLRAFPTRASRRYWCGDG